MFLDKFVLFREVDNSFFLPATITTSKSNARASLFSVSSLKNHVYDVICIGSGWASQPLAARAVNAGFTALIIDNELMGGDCLFWVCVPSKALLRPSEALDAAGAVGGA